MEFYIASRVKNREQVKAIHEKLIELGHTITSTWVEEKNQEAAKKRSIQCLKDSASCDVFILISDKHGAGMYTELGAALFANTLNNKPKIYVIGDYPQRSMFFFHPSIKRLEDIEKVLENLATRLNGKK